MLTTYVSSHIHTPVGVLEIQGTEKGVVRVRFLDEDPEELKSCEELSQCQEQLEQYFAGIRMTFDSLPLAFPSTDFQRDVWEELMKIPFGETISYGELAKKAGHEGAARAVGTAMNTNPLPIIIPCHRVLPADKTLGEYAFGVNRKMWLLQHESQLV